MAASDSYILGSCNDAAAPARRRGRLSRARFLQIFNACTLLGDFISCSLAILCVEIVSAMPTAVGGSLRSAVALAVVAAGLTALLLSREVANASFATSPAIRQTERVLRASVTSLIFAYLIDVSLGLHLLGARSLVLFVVVPLIIGLQRHAVSALRKQLHERGYGMDRVVVYYSGDNAPNQSLNDHRLLRLHGLHIVARLGGDERIATAEVIGEHPFAHSQSGGFIDLADLREMDCDLLGIIGQCVDETRLAELLAISEEIGLPVAMIDPLNFSANRSTIAEGELVIPATRNAQLISFAWSQRVLDVLVSVCLLIAFSPLLLLIAIAVKLDSEGPALFVQERIGHNGSPFRIFKFRSMFITTPQYELSPVQTFDPRITRVGRILRRLSMDELPQLINVLRGDMALVGPRPEMPFLVQRHAALHRIRLKVKPGITGLWQLSADRVQPIHQNIHHDLYYIRNRNLFLDLAILIHTWFRAAYGGV